MIEGDNLEVLKLLQKSYSGKVKLIYIDPPYNKRAEVIYPDDFRDSIKNYLQLTGQVDSDGRRLTSNSEASGRFHTDWLNMMYRQDLRVIVLLAHKLAAPIASVPTSLHQPQKGNEMATYRMEDVVVDTDNATNHWKEQRDHDGSNLLGRSSESQWSYQHLYRSRKGRYYIVHKSADTRMREYAEWVSPEEAARWLLLNDYEPLDELQKAVERVAE
jgi:hypothetical protein